MCARLAWSPDSAEVMVVDRVGSTVLAAALGGVPHAVFPIRHERVWLSPSVLLRMLPELRRLRLRGAADFRRLPGQLYRIHLLAALKAARPRVLVSFTDDSFTVRWLSRACDRPFFVVQNGQHTIHDLTDWLPPAPELGSSISMPVLLCFGDYDVDLYRACEHRIDTLYPVGALQAGVYRSRFEPPAEKRWDVCYVSQYTSFYMDGSNLPELGEGLRKMESLLAGYVRERGLRACVALRTTGDAEERAHFREVFGDSFELVENRREEFVTYREMDAARLVVTMHSTAAYEAFGWGAKTLFCNCSADPAYDFPTPGAWSLHTRGYEDFAARADELLEMEEAAWLASSAEARGYVMRYDDEHPAQQVLGELVAAALEDRRPAEWVEAKAVRSVDV